MSDDTFNDGYAITGRDAGFTVIELMVTVFIVAIGVAMALPSFREVTTRSTVTTISNDLVGALAQARAEAVKRGVFVAVTGSGSNWSGGWAIAADAGRDNSFNAPIAAHGAVKANFAVRTNGASPAQVVFSGQGNLVGTREFHINVCRDDKRADLSRFIRIKPSGEVTSQRDTAPSMAPAC